MTPNALRHAAPLAAALSTALALGCTDRAVGSEGAGEAGHGRVDFPVSCSDERAQEAIEEAVTLLHHMMYEQARGRFETAAEADPRCAMAQWGIAMTSFQPLWHPTSDEGLKRGKAAVEAARALEAPTAREQGYVAAAAAFFADPEAEAGAGGRQREHARRLEAWRRAQLELHRANPDDVDAAAFYALAEVALAMAEASPGQERTLDRERRAGALLERYLPQHPDHPGLHHYLIHAYDSRELAPKALEVARRYDRLAPEVPHALHMPSHIFVRLGHWEETASWNERSAEAALQHSIDGATPMHYPHALDYAMYAYLQLGDAEAARRTLERVRAIETAQPTFAAAYGIAAAQARYVLERRRWQAAAALEPATPDALDWEQFPAAEALFHYARGLGAARAGDLEQARIERGRLEQRVAALRAEGDAYWAHMTDALGRAVSAWIAYEQGDAGEALALMKKAADLEDALDKHPTTPGEVLPVRELYGELLLLEGRPDEARAAFEASLRRTPERRNALIGLRRAESMG